MNPLCPVDDKHLVGVCVGWQHALKALGKGDTEFNAGQYSNDLLPAFIEYVDDYWIPICAAKYLGDRDEMTLEYLPKLLSK